MTPPRASRSKSLQQVLILPPCLYSDSCQGAAGTSGASLDFMSKVPSPIGDVPRRFQRLYQLGLPLRPSASQSMAAPLAISSSQTPELLSAEVMPPPQGVLKKVSPTGAWEGSWTTSPISTIAPVLPEEAEEPVAAGNIGSVSDGGDIGPLEASDTEDDDSPGYSDPYEHGPPAFTPHVYLPLQGPPPSVLPPINYMNLLLQRSQPQPAVAASTAGGALSCPCCWAFRQPLEASVQLGAGATLPCRPAEEGSVWARRDDGELAETSYHSNLTSGDTGPSPHHPAPLAAFVITPRDSLILQEHITQFQNGSPSACANIIEKLIPELYQLRPPNTPFDKKDAGKFTHKWSSHSVFYQLNRDEVLELARETSGMDPGAPGFLGALQDATTVLWNALDADDQEDYAQAAKEWSQDAPPPMFNPGWHHLAQADCPGLPKATVQNMCAYKTKDNDLSIGLVQDDVESVLDDGISFLNFCPDWKTAPLWEQWTQFGIHCFSQADDPLEEDPVEVLAKPDHSKMITTKIPISMDMSGCPELPTVTMLDGYKTKVVQSMLREYCTAHMRFITGRKNQVIPWGSLVNDPLTWIPQECIPDGFEWKDPSKIQIGEIFHLLDHWRDRQDQGHVPLTWVPSCPPFQEGQPSQHLQKIRETVVAMQPLESDEEVFVLPHSDEIDEEEDEADPGNTGAVEEPLSVVDAFQVEPDKAGTSAKPLVRQQPYKGKGSCTCHGQWYYQADEDDDEESLRLEEDEALEVARMLSTDDHFIVDNNTGNVIHLGMVKSESHD
ncbi:hypothetical protein EI94DRAFT_1708787 [Lactarius quietus]|nr:hypothetical protein EI94DRAFT_1708787 [Lactarius quietus]